MVLDVSRAVLLTMALLAQTTPGKDSGELRPGEHPMIRKIVFSGENYFSAETLAADLQSRIGEPLDELTLQEDRLALLGRYHAEGFVLADIRSRVTPADDAPGAVEIAFSIDESHRVTISAIHVEGTEQIPTSHVLAAIKHRRRILFGLVSRGYYRPEDFEQDLERVRRLYRSRGYLDVVVARGPVTFSRASREVELSIRVLEGPRYCIEAIELGNNNPSLTRALKFQIRSRPGDLYDGKVIEKDRRRILDFYQRQTRRVPRVEVSLFFHLSPDDHRVRVSFDIDERQHLYTGRVRVTGNRRTRAHVVRDRVTAVPGSPLTGIELEESASSLRTLGIFADIEARSGSTGSLHHPDELEAGDDATDYRDVSLSVTEKPEGFFEIGGGASSGEGEIFTVRLSHTNIDIFDIPGGARGWDRPFTGGGQTLKVRVDPGTRISEYEVLFEEPHLYNSFHKLSMGSITQIIRWRKFDEIQVKGEVGVRRFWDQARRISTGISWALRDVNITDVDDNAPGDVLEEEGHTLLSYPKLLLGYSDASIDYYSGRAGLTAWTQLELPLAAVGSESDHVKSLTTLDWAVRLNAILNRMLPGDPLDEDSVEIAHTLRLGGRVGWMKDVGGGETPFFDRFAPGGPRDFRGFDYRGVGPHQKGVPLGGNAFWYGTIEYSFPLVLREIRVVGLFDFGDVEDSFSGFAIDRVRTAAGGGLQLRLDLAGAVIPVNLFWVEALHKEDGDRARFFTFTLGYLF